MSIARGDFRRTPSPFVDRASFMAPYDSIYGARLKRAKYGGQRPLLRALSRDLARTIAPHTFYRQFDRVVQSLHRGRVSFAVDFAPPPFSPPRSQTDSISPPNTPLTLSPGSRQAGLRRAARRENMSHRLFSCRAAPGRVLLVDDVLTTGTTSHQAALELLGDATAHVHVLTLCCVVTAVQAS